MANLRQTCSPHVGQTLPKKEQKGMPFFSFLILQIIIVKTLNSASSAGPKKALYSCDLRQKCG